MLFYTDQDSEEGGEFCHIAQCGTWTYANYHEENIEEENNGYVVFSLKYPRNGGEERYNTHPPFYSKLLYRY